MSFYRVIILWLTCFKKKLYCACVRACVTCACCVVGGVLQLASGFKRDTHAQLFEAVLRLVFVERGQKSWIAKSEALVMAKAVPPD